MAVLDATAISTAATQLLEHLHNSAACTRTLAQQRQTALETWFDDTDESHKAHSATLVVLSRMCGAGRMPTTTLPPFDLDDARCMLLTVQCTVSGRMAWICLDEFPVRVVVLHVRPWHPAEYKSSRTWLLGVRFYMVSSNGKRVSARVAHQGNGLDVSPVELNIPRKMVLLPDAIPDVFNVLVHVHRFDSEYNDLGFRIRVNLQTLYKAVNIWP